MPGAGRMSAVIETRMRYLQRQIKNLQSLILQPSGIFETIDSMVKTFRMANRATMQQLTRLGGRGGGMAGQMLKEGPLRKMLKRWG